MYDLMSLLVNLILLHVKFIKSCKIAETKI